MVPIFIFLYLEKQQKTGLIVIDIVLTAGDCISSGDFILDRDFISGGDVMLGGGDVMLGGGDVMLGGIRLGIGVFPFIGSCHRLSHSCRTNIAQQSS
ncbi:unnamed protein product [Rotaria sordida]|uniref:Uncharacterized protein n=1 Tax=Rotaria sordida TaxID=392033 RepID=A0A814GM19_9BILA|nr:unnamed protein product [Rotaria sordida]CAF0998159.1 unnamed protein product [Rotaria sordida]